MAYDYADTRWCLRWDSDMVALPTLGKVLDFASMIDEEKKRNYAFHYYVQDPDTKVLHREDYLFTKTGP